MDTENDANDTPGSPVLGSSNFKKRFLKPKYSRKNAKIRLSERFENEIVPSSSSPNEINNGNSPSNSFSKVDNSVDQKLELNKEELVITKCESDFKSLANNDLKTVGFKTASGKPLCSKKDSSDFANNLMKEFFNPLIVTNREKKHSFLSKSSSRKNLQLDSPKLVEDENFLGFEQEECSFSLKKHGNFEHLIHVLSSKTVNSVGSESNEKFHVDSRLKEKPEKSSSSLREPEYAEFHAVEENVKLDPMDDGLFDFSESIFMEIEETRRNADKPRRSDVKLLRKISSDSVQENASGNRPPCSFEEIDRVNENKVSNNIENCIDNRSSGTRNHHLVKKPEEEQKMPQFSTGSGRKINICPSLIKKVQGIFEDFSDNKIDANTVLKTELEQQALMAKIEVKNVDFKIPQFSTASGNKINISSDKLSKISSVFKDITDLKISDYITNFPETPNHKEGEILGKTVKDYSIKNSSHFSNTNSQSSVSKSFNANSSYGVQSEVQKQTQQSIKCSSEKVVSLFSTASGKNIELPSSSLSRIDKIFGDIPDFNDVKAKIKEDFSNCNIVQDSKKMELSITTDLPTFSPLRINNDISQISSATNTVQLKHTPVKNISSVTEDKGNISIQPACKTMLEIQSNEGDTANFITPQKSTQRKKRLGAYSSRDGKISDTALNRAKSLFGDMNFDDLKLPPHLKVETPKISQVSLSTPGRSNKICTPQFSSTPIRSVKKNESFLNYTHQESNHPFIIQKPTSGSLEDLEDELNKQKNILEKKLELVVKRQEAVKNQIHSQTTDKRFKLENYEKTNKINLKDVKNLEMQSRCTQQTNSIVLNINPQNATLIHFSNNWYEVPVVTTEDGCVLVPNFQGFIGISEIEPAFSSMPGVEKNLIPVGWVKNHYRWIIWKLASYERFFPATLGGCFNINNVIKQLKYRYIRELYNAERPALRKIYELDDVPHKRMILCISNIIKNGDDTELELTDGWYCMRTMIDELICRQINKKKIKIGSKLIITGAELLNCPGCHPLETEQSSKARLKIHFNSTRRAPWSSKLGYQKDPSPLPIKLSSAIWNGGNIGRTTVFVMRVYPVIYREQSEGSVLWRNQNAEYKRFQEFENECMRKFEEGINVNIVKRKVCPVLQMTVIDVSDELPKPFKCIIWDSTDSHEEQLKENQVVSFYNLMLRANGELSCNKKTFFQVSNYKTVKYEKYRRKCVELANYELMSENTSFGEFDTVGFIVKKSVEQNRQHFWLTDLKNGFLLVEINEGPNNCLFLHKVEENNLVAVCNLTLKSKEDEYVIASASLQTILSQYPQYDFLRVKMEELGKASKNEILCRLNEMRELVETFENRNRCEQTPHFGDSEENKLNFSRVTSTDNAMSMINIDEIVTHHKK